MVSHLRLLPRSMELDAAKAEAEFKRLLPAAIAARKDSEKLATENQRAAGVAAESAVDVAPAQDNVIVVGNREAGGD